MMTRPAHFTKADLNRAAEAMRKAGLRVTAAQPIVERIRIREASRITGLDIRTLQEKAARGEIRGAEKPFGRWTFDIAELRRLRSKGRQCAVSTGGAGYGGRVSRFAGTNIAAAYERALARSRSAG